MKNSIILNKIQNILTYKLNIKKKIKPQFDLTKLKNWDSLKHLDFVMCIEKEFNIKIKVKNIFEIKKLNDFCQMVKKSLQT